MGRRAAVDITTAGRRGLNTARRPRIGLLAGALAAVLVCDTATALALPAHGRGTARVPRVVAAKAGRLRVAGLATFAGERSLTVGPLSSERLLTEIAGDADRAVAAVDRLWQTPWAGRVVVLVPGSPPQWSALLGGSVVSPDTAAVTARTPVRPGTWGLPAAERIVVNAAAFTRLSPVGRQVVLTHEVMHVAAMSVTTAATPLWLVEGLADFAGYRDSGLAVTDIAAELRSDLRAGRVPAALPNPADFAAGGGAVPQAYEQAWWAVRLIAQRYGITVLLRFYRAAGAGAGPPGAVLARACRSQLRLSIAQFEREWVASMRRQLA